MESFAVNKMFRNLISFPCLHFSELWRAQSTKSNQN